MELYTASNSFDNTFDINYPSDFFYDGMNRVNMHDAACQSSYSDDWFIPLDAMKNCQAMDLAGQSPLMEVEPVVGDSHTLSTLTETPEEPLHISPALTWSPAEVSARELSPNTIPIPTSSSETSTSGVVGFPQALTSARKLSHNVHTSPNGEYGAELRRLGATLPRGQFPLTREALANYFSTGQSAASLFESIRSNNKNIWIAREERGHFDYQYTCKARCRLGKEVWVPGKVCNAVLGGRESYVRHVRGTHIGIGRGKSGMVAWAIAEQARAVKKTKGTRNRASRSSSYLKMSSTAADIDRDGFEEAAPTGALRRSPRHRTSS